jgi:peptide/nickel transport system permease protein
MSSRFFFRRVLQIIPQFLILSVIIFLLLRFLPGDPAETPAMSLGVGVELTPEEIEARRAYLGLDKPVAVQYFLWLKSFLVLDMGKSYTSGDPVEKLIGKRLGPTLALMGTSFLISTTLGILFGVLSAYWQHTLLDHVLTFFAFFWVSIPGFWGGMLFIILFAVTLGWLPAGGMNAPGVTRPLPDLRHLVLPAMVLGLEGMASLTRFVRSSMLNVLAEDYMRTAKSKGLREWVVLTRHGLKNALMPAVTILGLRLPQLVGGTILIETVFSWPGLGTLAVTAAKVRDYPVTMAMVSIVGVMTILGNLGADLAYGILDPRVRQK